MRGAEGVEVDPSGNVYVLDPGNDRVQKFSKDGEFITKWGFFGSMGGQFFFGDNQRLTVDPSGNVYIADGGNSRLQKFTGGGTYIVSFGSRCDIRSSNGCNLSAPGAIDPGDGQFLSPFDIATDSTGAFVYVTDYSNHRTQIFGPPQPFPWFP